MKLRLTTIASRISLLFSLCWTSLAFAEPILNGLATHTNFGKDQFIAALYCESPSDDARTVLLDTRDKAMELRVVVDQLYPRHFRRMWIESMAINAGSAELEKHAQAMANFSNMLQVKLRVGDIFRIERKAATGVRILVDGHLLGVIPDPHFFDLLLRTWIGPVPLSTQLKNGLLANGNPDEDLRRLYNTTRPSPERILAISSALSDKAKEDTAATNAPTPAETSNGETVTPAKPAVAGVEPTPPASDTTDKTDTPKTEPTPTAPTTAAVAAVPAAPVKPVVAAVKPGLVSEKDLFEQDSILDEEPEELITAETLLAQQLYISKLTRWTGGFVEYPRRAQRTGQEGTVRLTITINRDGEVKDVSYEDQTEYKLLNQAAYKAVKKASPFPAMPPTISGDSYVFSVPVTFRLQ